MLEEESGDKGSAQICTSAPTLAGLGRHKVLDEGICGLRVKREGVLEGLQLIRLVHVGHLEPITTGMEVLFDHFKPALKHSALFGCQALFPIL